jgi:phage terminase large subunit GpA-like protein
MRGNVFEFQAKRMVAPLGTRLREVFETELKRESLGNMEFARTITLPDGDWKGDTYDPSLHPAQACLLQAIDAGASWVAVAKPVQDGGSLATLVPILRRVVQHAQTALIAFPTLEGVKENWTTKVWPMLEAQGGMTPETGGGSRGGASRVTNLPTGGKVILRAAGGRGESGAANATVDCELIDEVDDWKEMRRLRLMERRMSKSPDPLLLYVSTVKSDGEKDKASLILRLVEQGTGTRLEYPCPHCGVFQTLEWERVDVETATITCASCPAKLAEHERQRMLKQWRRKDERKTGKFSILWSALDSPFPIVIDAKKHPVVPGLCIEFEQAQEDLAIGDHSAMRQFTRDRLTRAYLGDRDSGEDAPLTWEALLRRSMASEWGPTIHTTDRTPEDTGHRYSRHLAPIPPGATFAIGTVDMQGNRIYPALYAYDFESTSWDVAWSYEYARNDHEPWSKAELFALLDQTHALFRAWAQGLPIAAIGLDTGDFTDEAKEWLVGRPAPWVAIKGEARQLLEKEPDDIAGVIVTGTNGLRLIHTENTREQVHAMYRRSPGQPGAIHLPRGLERNPSDLAYLRHLIGEIKVIDPRTGNPKLKKTGRWDWLDCRRYAHALAQQHLRRVLRAARDKEKANELAKIPTQPSRSSWDSAATESW